MSVIEKCLNKIFGDIDEYREIINFTYPVLFSFSKNKQQYVGFVNQYKPSSGLVSFLISETSISKLSETIENNTVVKDLFCEASVHYLYQKGNVIMEQENYNNYLPDTSLSVQVPFNALLSD